VEEGGAESIKIVKDTVPQGKNKQCLITSRELKGRGKKNDRENKIRWQE
jgi:hypothetical protein